MKTLIVILILASFLQTSILPYDLVLITLILRAYIKPESANLYLAFFFGLLISHLRVLPLGWYSILYLILALCAQLLSKSRLSVHVLTVIPVILMALFIKNVVFSWWFHQSLILWPNIFLEATWVIPIYFLITFLEEHLSVKDIKLRI